MVIVTGIQNSWNSRTLHADFDPGRETLRQSKKSSRSRVNKRGGKGNSTLLRLFPYYTYSTPLVQYLLGVGYFKFVVGNIY
jgi:hypothetical protein